MCSEVISFTIIPKRQGHDTPGLLLDETLLSHSVNELSWMAG